MDPLESKLTINPSGLILFVVKPEDQWKAIITCLFHDDDDDDDDDNNGGGGDDDDDDDIMTMIKQVVLKRQGLTFDSDSTV